MNRAGDLLSGFSLSNRCTKDRVMDFYVSKLNEVKNKEFEYGKYKAFSIVFNGFFMHLLDI